MPETLIMTKVSALVDPLERRVEGSMPATRLGTKSLARERAFRGGLLAEDQVVGIRAQTLTPRQFEMRDPEGKLRFRFALSDYQMVGGIPWPTLLAARSADG